MDANAETKSGILGELDPSLIRAQLKKILNSAQFSDTTRLKRFLEHLVRETLEGRGDQIKGYSLGVDVFDKSEDFDSQADTIVRVQAKKLRMRLMLYYASEGANDPVRIEIPKGQYTPVFTLAVDPFPNEGEQELGSGVTMGDRISIAVMPLENVSGDPSQEGQATALTEDISAALSKFRELRIISRTLTAKYTAAGKCPISAGASLSARYLLGGAYGRLSGKLRAVINLICAETGEQLFSEVFHRDADDNTLFEVHDDVAARAATKIADRHGFLHRLDAEQRRESKTLNAFQASLRATEYWRAPSVEAHERIREQLEIAVRDEPTYAAAWGMLSMVYGDDARFGFRSDPNPSTLAQALEAAERSIQLDPLNATGLYAMSLAQFHVGNIPAYKDMAKRAVAANSNFSDMLADLSMTQAMVGELASARELNRRAFELCPDPPGWFHTTTFVIHFTTGEYDEALEASRRIGGAFWASPTFCNALALSALGSFEEANEQLQLFLEKWSDLDAFLQLHFKLWNVPPFLCERVTDLLGQLPAGQSALNKS